MRDYEIVYIFRVSLTPNEIEAKLKRYHAIIADDGSGEVTASVHWGKRQLAYPIQKQPNGYYAVAQFTSAPGSLQELERELKLDDGLLRYLVVIREHPWPLPDPAPTAPKPEEPGAEEAGDAEGDAEDASESEETEEGDAEAAADDASAEAEAESEAPADEADAEQGDADADAGEPEESAGAKEE